MIAVFRLAAGWGHVAAGLAIASLLAAQARAAIEIDAPLDASGQSLLVRLPFNGQPETFILDTGSAVALSLTPEAMARVEARRDTGRSIHTGDLAGRTFNLNVWTLDTVDVAGHKMHDVQAVELVDWGLRLGTSHPARLPYSVIGAPFFRGRSVMIDLPGNRLVVGDDLPGTTGPGWVNFSTEYDRNGIAVQVMAGSRKSRMVVDSASTISLVKQASVTGQHECDLALGAKTPCRAVDVKLPSGRTIQALVRPLPELFTDDGILGKDFFAQGPVLINLQEQALVSQKLANPTSR